MSNKKRKIESSAITVKKAKLDEKPSPVSSVPAPVPSKPAQAGVENKKLSKKNEKRKLFKKEIKKKLLKEGKLSRGLKKKKKPKMETSGTAQTTTAPPKKPEEISANWKALQQVLQKENGSSKKKKKKFLPLKKEKAMPATTKPVEKESEAEKPAKPEIWFEIDDENLLEHSADEVDKSEPAANANDLGTLSGPSKDAPTGLTDIVGLDCEMVGVGEGGIDSILARISIVNQHGHPVYDKYVKPTESVCHCTCWHTSPNARKYPNRIWHIHMDTPTHSRIQSTQNQILDINLIFPLTLVHR